ncbi:hypothetical protein [Pseudomonas sp. PH1b]|uniref:hypothetical protein n=1 Tax=Pseudomonas sp. PH1b TaxID=1397282 RepID=UPI0012FED049|nr:hypothetical protein [Pseudomonas sp. PH1b]
MTLTSKQQADNWEASNAIVIMIDSQVRRDVDLVHAQQYWAKTLEEAPTAVLVEALSYALASGRYQEAPRNRCHCCTHRH